MGGICDELKCSSPYEGLDIKKIYKTDKHVTNAKYYSSSKDRLLNGEMEKIENREEKHLNTTNNEY